MYLQRLDITGFKSFAQKTTLTFDRGIVSIVGPNGSGKSNAADAIRWVLGEQSMKLLRGKKSEDIIFSGSSQKARLGMAEVSLTLENGDRQMPVDYGEVVITRRMDRAGQGEYLLNKQPVRLQDVQLLLAKSNFAQRTYSVIGQGMIDHVLVASPAERKQFFDEAAGVRQFQIKREQAMHKLEQTKENLGQAQLLLNEIEPRLRTLTRQVRRLERRGAIEEELRTVQQQYYTQRSVALQQQLGELEATLRTQQERRREHEEDLAALQQELEGLEKERTRQEVFQSLQGEYGRGLEQKNAVLKELAMLEGVEELEAAQRGELNVVWLQNRSRELERSRAELQEEITTLEREHGRVQHNLAQHGKRLAAVRAKLATLERSFEDIRTRTGSGQSDVASIEQELRVFHEEFQGFRATLERAASDSHWQKLKRDAVRFHEKLAGLLLRFQRAKRGVQAHDVLQIQDEFQQFQRTKDELVQTLQDGTNELVRRTERLTVLRESAARLQEEQDRVSRELERFQPAAGSARTPVQQRTDLEKQLQTFDARLQELRLQMMNFNQTEQEKKEHLFQLQKSFRVKQNELSEATAAANTTRVAQAKLETRRDDLLHEIRAELPATLAETVIARTASDAPGHAEPEEKLAASINDLRRQLEMIGGIDDAVTEEYKQTDERHAFLAGQVQDLASSIESLETVIQELDETIRSQFHRAFTAINREFAKYFQILFNGGKAQLVLQEVEVTDNAVDAAEEDEDAADDEPAMPASPKRRGKKEKIIAGVEILATPPGKRIAGITMLSGGERAMTSIALICAILATRPSPFVVLDEVDAALDEANTQRFAAILKELSHRTQFITITHNRSTMQISSILYGVTMNDDGVSRLLSIKLEDAEKVIAAHGNRA